MDPNYERLLECNVDAMFFKTKASSLKTIKKPLDFELLLDPPIPENNEIVGFFGYHDAAGRIGFISNQDPWTYLKSFDKFKLS